MKYKGKIIQIIEEKKAKNYVLDWQQNVIPNHDYLNIRPAEEREVPLNWRMPFYICMGICLIVFVISLIFPSISVTVSAISIIGLLAILFFGTKMHKKYKFQNVPKGIWYFNDAFAVEKPHNYKVGDIVKIELNLNHIQNEK